MEALPVFVLIVFVLTLCVAGVMLEHRARQVKRAARKPAGVVHRAESYGPGGLFTEPIRQNYTPVSQYRDYQPAGHTSEPVSTLAAAVWQAHVDAQNLDAQILTGSAIDVATAVARVRKSTSQLMREMTKEFEDTL